MSVAAVPHCGTMNAAKQTARAASETQWYRPQARNTVYVCEWTRYYFDSMFSCSILNSFLADAVDCIRANGKGIHVRVHSHGIELHL